MMSWTSDLYRQMNNMSVKPTTNADRIRKMSDEELALNHATIFAEACKCEDPSDCKKEEWNAGYSPCSQCVLEWLKQPAKGE